MELKVGDKVVFSEGYSNFLKEDNFTGESWNEKALHHIEEENNKPMKITGIDEIHDLYKIKELGQEYMIKELKLAQNKVKKL